jgi:hypothetical protein
MLALSTNQTALESITHMKYHWNQETGMSVSVCLSMINGKVLYSSTKQAVFAH